MSLSPHVLVVEDDDEIRDSVCRLLDEHGYRVEAARNGSDALAALQTQRPSVVLLDLMMPVMNGWELTATMRDSAELAEIPIIVMSAAGERFPPGIDKVLTKPFTEDALVDAVQTYGAAGEDDLVQIPRRELRALSRKNVELAELQRFCKDVAVLIVHDLKNPLSVVVANVAYAKDLVGADADCFAALKDAERAALRMERLITNLLDLAQLETGHFLPRRGVVDLTAVAKALLRSRRQNPSNLQIDTELSPVTASVDVDLIERTLENLLDNAFRYAATRILVRVGSDEQRIVIVVANDGPAIAADARATIFEKFVKSGERIRSSNFGLGLYFCRLAVEAHGGSIRVETSPEFNTLFVVELPR